MRSKKIRSQTCFVSDSSAPNYIFQNWLKVFEQKIRGILCLRYIMNSGSFWSAWCYHIKRDKCRRKLIRLRCANNLKNLEKLDQVSIRRLAKAAPRISISAYCGLTEYIASNFSAHSFTLLLLQLCEGVNQKPSFASNNPPPSAY